MNEQLKIIISAEVNKLKQGVKDAKEKIKEFTQKAAYEIQRLNDAFQKVGNASKTVLKVMGGAIAGASTALLALGASTKEYRQQQGMLASAFEAAGGSAETAKQTYNDLYRVLGDSGKATEAAQHLGKLTTEEKALSEWTNICQGVYATFGDSLPIESLTEAVNHSAKLGEVQGTLADALEWSGVNMDDFNEQLFWCNSESEREKLIRDTLNGVYSDAASLYEENNAQVLAQNEAQISLQDSMAKLGEATAPILTMLTQLLVDILAPLTPKLQEFIDKYGPQIKDTLTKVGEAIGKVITWIADNWEIVSTLAIVIAAISAALTVFSTVMTIVNAVMAASPVTWIVLAIVAAIAALIAIIVLVIKYWDEIKGAAVKAWEGIKNVWSTVANWFNTKIIQPIVNFFTGLWDKITGIFKKVGTFFKDAFTGAVNGIKSAFSTVANFFSGIWDKITGIFKSVGSTIANAITGTVKKAINGVLSSAISIINGFISAINLAIGVINLIPGVSISKLNKLSVPKLARGGVVDSATLAVVGEQGKEAVVPLENNLEWLDKLATMLGDKLGGGVRGDMPIVLTVDGKVFAQTAIRTINDNTKSTGKLALVVR